MQFSEVGFLLKFVVILFFQPVTHHGVGKKLGGGKGSIKYYGTPVRAGRVILEVGGNVYWEEVRPWLNRICKMFSFEVRFTFD